jgi:hypothetical protein
VDSVRRRAELRLEWTRRLYSELPPFGYYECIARGRGEIDAIVGRGAGRGGGGGRWRVVRE